MKVNVKVIVSGSDSGVGGGNGVLVASINSSSSIVSIVVVSSCQQCSSVRTCLHMKNGRKVSWAVPRLPR